MRSMIRPRSRWSTAPSKSSPKGSGSCSIPARKQADRPSRHALHAASFACVGVTRYGDRVIPWLIFALVAVPLVVVGFVTVRRRNDAIEHPASADAQLTEQEFAEA